tara:strand:- start:1122 stop:1439 length:318 start_codon:yes stop_codon:yes gene_type:complete
MKLLRHKFILLFLAVYIFTGCSSMESSGIKEWLKEGTKEYQVEDEEVTSSSKKGIKKLLERRGCISGSSARVIETENSDVRVYEVTCVEKSNRFIVKCDENSCSE